MYIYRRIFTSLVVCILLLGCIVFIRQQVSDNSPRNRAVPEFLPNVPRFRASRVCSIRALVLVESDPGHSLRRQVIRDTWAYPSVTQPLDISVAFGVGATDSVDVQRSLDWEAEIYGDIFQNSPSDTSSKVMPLLKSARSACSPLPEFVMKTEDDVFVNTFLLGELLENLETFSSSNTMWCLEWNRKLDRLGDNSTWAVLKTQLSGTGHPSYCVGTVYLMTGRALDAIILRHDAQSGKTLLPEEVYVTGMLTKEARVTLSLLGERFVIDGQELDAGQVAFAYLGDRTVEDTNKLWGVLVKEKKIADNSRRSDVGL